MTGVVRQRGVTLPELLVVVTIIALAVLVAVPTISETVRAARLRSAARSFEATMRAARILAVTRQQDASVVVQTAADRYTYTDLQGRPRIETLPSGIRIVSSTSPIVFRPNGTLDAEAVTVLEVRTRTGTRTWEVRTSRMGVTRVID